MEVSADELAGVVDLFGALSRGELRRAVENIAARQGEEFEAGALDAAVEAALEDYYLVEVGDRLAVGPAALPTLPEHGPDLPHMLDVEPRNVDREAVAEAAEERLRADAARAAGDGDRERVRDLLDVCYEMDAWGVDTGDIRERLDAALG